MARRAVIEREEFFDAANRLQEEGKPVTALAVHEALGGGSLTTIYKHFKDWKTTRATTERGATSAEIPDQVQGAFASAWRVASMEAALEVSAAKEKAAEEVKEAQKQFEGALEAIEQLEAESENDAAQIEALKSRVAELEAALAAAGNDNAALKATAEQLRHQVKSHQTEIERLHKERDEDRKLHQDELNRAKVEHAAAQEKLEQKREEAIKQASELKGQAETLKEQNAELMSRLSSGAPANKEKRKPE